MRGFRLPSNCSCGEKHLPRDQYGFRDFNKSAAQAKGCFPVFTFCLNVSACLLTLLYGSMVSGDPISMVKM